MLLLKIAVTILFVTGLSLVAERVSPRAAGVLSGYPAGTAISLFFIGLEQGAVFAGQSAPYNVAGLTAMLLFLYAYYSVSRRFSPSRSRILTIVLPSLAATTCFLLGIAGLHLLRLPPWSGVLLTAAAIPICIFLFRRIPDTRIARRVTFGPRVLLFRASLAALVILTITGAANVVPASLAGLISAFPATVFPLVLIIHSTYGPLQAHTIIKNFPKGVGALVVYSLAVAAAYPRAGVGWGTAIAFAAATVFLLCTAPFVFPKTAIIETK